MMKRVQHAKMRPKDPPIDRTFKHPLTGTNAMYYLFTSDQCLASYLLTRLAALLRGGFTDCPGKVTCAPETGHPLKPRLSRLANY